MDKSHLAQKMLEWETLIRQLDTLGAEIEEAVLELGKTVDAGNVRASYSEGRKRYDYAKAANENLSFNMIKRYQTTLTKVNWKLACEECGVAEVEPIPFTQSNPSVTLKLKE